jgi:diguanylate cyclase (GGDEF)-like protein/PAS domain S-box-containing protein
MKDQCVMKNLQDLLEYTHSLESSAVIQELDADEFPAQEKAAATVILKLLQERREYYLSNRRNMAELLADADALSDTLVRIGLGDFSAPVADVHLKGLKTIRMGIEDMQLQLRKAREELDKLIVDLRDSEDRFRQLVESTSDWIWEMDKDGRYQYASPQIEAILGYSPEEMIGRTPFEMMPKVEAERLCRVFIELVNSAAPIIQLESKNLHKEGRKVVLETSGTPFLNQRGEVEGYRGVNRDVTRRKRMEEELRRLASHDSLTGLYNRQVLQKRIQEEVARAYRYKRPLTAFMIDIDHFKIVNDTYGHSAGDDVLKAVAKVLINSLRKTDFIARYGGEEFVVLLLEADLKSAAEHAERVRGAIYEHPFRISDGRVLEISSSIGVASFPQCASDGQSLLAVADKALYNAKHSGRNQVVMADEISSGSPEP